MLDAVDRAIVNRLQDGFPLSSSPYASCAAELGLSEADLIERLGRLLETRTLTRFGPFFNAEKMGGDFCLCAMAVPEERFASVAARVNAHHEVAHNYRRDHTLNMWFVLGVEDGDEIARLAKIIERETGLAVYLFPKLEEYFLDMRVPA